MYSEIIYQIDLHVSCNDLNNNKTSIIQFKAAVLYYIYLKRYFEKIVTNDFIAYSEDSCFKL